MFIMNYDCKLARGKNILELRSHHLAEHSSE